MTWSRLCLWLQRRWPWSCYNRLMWPVELWVIGQGSDALMAEIYPDTFQ